MNNLITIRRGEGGSVGKGGPLWSPVGGASSRPYGSSGLVPVFMA
jgi:hypothetical protein